MFRKNSYFDRSEHESDQEFHERIAESAVNPGPRKALVKTASIPISELENWVGSLEVAENGGDIEDVLLSMRSYFRG